MPTPHPADACPSLHVLAGTLGLNSEGNRVPCHADILLAIAAGKDV